MDNKKIAQVFEEMADMLEISGESFFRVNAYRKGALTVENLGEDLRNVRKGGEKLIEEIPGIGKALAEKIIELVDTGKCVAYEKMRAGFPTGLLEILKVRGIGPKKVKLFYENLAVDSVAKLKAAAEKGLIRELPKMGEKSEAEILTAIGEFEQFSGERVLVHIALYEAERLMGYLRGLPELLKIEYAGSLRRRQESIGDIDILTTAKDPEKVRKKVMAYFVAYDEVLTVVAQGDTKSSVILKSGIHCDLRLVEPVSFGAALHYFTGSKDHNIVIRDLAKKQGLKVNEYGVFDGEKRVCGENEEEIFGLFGLPWVPPELRKGDLEFEYGLKHGKFPRLIEESDLRGDLHCHSLYSDGKRTIEEMAAAMMAKGYEYFAMTDHSKAMGITGGMDEEKIRRQWTEIDELNKKLAGKIRILKGCEVDILKDGDLDFGDEILKELDVVVASAHLHGRLPAEQQTKRLLKALENPYVKILGHPTGRLINKRAEMEFDMDAVVKAAVANGVALEINASPSRLDLPDKYLRRAKEMGAKFTIDTDSHDSDQIEFMQFGVGIARRGWLTKADVVNTRALGADLTLSFE
ncbi:DNA polymerase/3'-5' exonuclease PolX [Candidatus Gracilibacteria bacterium]|nr:DNA polymerase/3'-5' exonuclease PolX [Candidatus Gracilibacteria bacterium]